MRFNSDISFISSWYLFYLSAFELIHFRFSFSSDYLSCLFRCSSSLKAAKHWSWLFSCPFEAAIDLRLERLISLIMLVILFLSSARTLWISYSCCFILLFSASNFMHFLGF